jgi:hypothetical protein
MIFDDYYIFNTEQIIIKFINKYINKTINKTINISIDETINKSINKMNNTKIINNSLIYSKIYKSYKKYNCIYDKNIMDIILLNE